MRKSAYEVLCEQVDIASLVAAERKLEAFIDESRDNFYLLTYINMDENGFKRALQRAIADAKTCVVAFEKLGLPSVSAAEFEKNLRPILKQSTDEFLPLSKDQADTLRRNVPQQLSHSDNDRDLLRGAPHTQLTLTARQKRLLGQQLTLSQARQVIDHETFKAAQFSANTMFSSGLFMGAYYSMLRHYLTLPLAWVHTAVSRVNASIIATIISVLFGLYQGGKEYHELRNREQQNRYRLLKIYNKLRAYRSPATKAYYQTLWDHYKERFDAQYREFESMKDGKRSREIKDILSKLQRIRTKIDRCDENNGLECNAKIEKLTQFIRVQYQPQPVVTQTPWHFTLMWRHIKKQIAKLIPNFITHYKMVLFRFFYVFVGALLLVAAFAVAYYFTTFAALFTFLATTALGAGLLSTFIVVALVLATYAGYQKYRSINLEVTAAKELEKARSTLKALKPYQLESYIDEGLSLLNEQFSLLREERQSASSTDPIRQLFDKSSPSPQTVDEFLTNNVPLHVLFSFAFNDRLLAEYLKQRMNIAVNENNKAHINRIVNGKIHQAIGHLFELRHDSLPEINARDFAERILPNLQKTAGTVVLGKAIAKRLHIAHSDRIIINARNIHPFLDHYFSKVNDEEFIARRDALLKDPEVRQRMALTSSDKRDVLAQCEDTGEFITLFCEMVDATNSVLTYDQLQLLADALQKHKPAKDNKLIDRKVRGKITILKGRTVTDILKEAADVMLTVTREQQRCMLQNLTLHDITELASIPDSSVATIIQNAVTTGGLYFGVSYMEISKFLLIIENLALRGSAFRGVSYVSASLFIGVVAGFSQYRDVAKQRQGEKYRLYKFLQTTSDSHTRSESAAKQAFEALAILLKPLIDDEGLIKTKAVELALQIAANEPTYREKLLSLYKALKRLSDSTAHTDEDVGYSSTDTTSITAPLIPTQPEQNKRENPQSKFSKLSRSSRTHYGWTLILAILLIPLLPLSIALLLFSFTPPVYRTITHNTFFIKAKNDHWPYLKPHAHGLSRSVITFIGAVFFFLTIKTVIFGFGVLSVSTPALYGIIAACVIIALLVSAYVWYRTAQDKRNTAKIAVIINNGKITKIKTRKVMRLATDVALSTASMLGQFGDTDPATDEEEAMPKHTSPLFMASLEEQSSDAETWPYSKVRKIFDGLVIAPSG